MHIPGRGPASQRNCSLINGGGGCGCILNRGIYRTCHGLPCTTAVVRVGSGVIRHGARQRQRRRQQASMHQQPLATIAPREFT